MLIRYKKLAGIIVVILFFLVGCSHKMENSSDKSGHAQYYYFLLVESGNFQNAPAGEWLEQPIVIKVINNEAVPVSDIPLKFEIICGGGSLDKELISTDNSGKVESRWGMGGEPDQILKVSISGNSSAARAMYIFANTDLRLDLNWISGIPFQIERASVPHDDDILESNHFLIFSDASSRDVKVIFMKMAEEALLEIKQAFGIQSIKDLGVISSNRETKIKIFSNKGQSHAQMAFPLGFYIDGLDSDVFLGWWNGNQTLLRQWYRREVKHETMHVMQWLLGLDWDPGLSWHEKWGQTWPEFWFSEGIAEYISGGAFDAIENLEQVHLWFRDPDHVIPVGIIRSDDSPVPDSRIGEYYPMFGLAVRYLLEQEGQGRTFSDVMDMYLDMIQTRDFRQSFEKIMGISVEFYQENFLELIIEFFNRTEFLR